MSDQPDPCDVSVIAPVFDERDNLEPLVRGLLDQLRPTGQDFELLLVDDGSRDGSADTIAALAAAHPEVRGLHLARRCGQTSAFDAGFKAARGRRVVTIDSDLQYDPADVTRLLDALDRHPVAVGYRQLRRDSLLRRISSSVARFFYRRLCGDDFLDTGCSLKAFRRECLADLKLYNGMHRFLPTLLRMQGHEIAEVAVSHRPRASGRSKYGIRNRAFRAFIDLLAVRWMKKRRLDYEVVRYEP